MADSTEQQLGPCRVPLLDLDLLEKQIRQHAVQSVTNGGLIERDSVVAWLRGQCEHGEPCGSHDPDEPRCKACHFALAIQEGDHA